MGNNLKVSITVIWLKYGKMVIHTKETGRMMKCKDSVNTLGMTDLSFTAHLSTTNLKALVITPSPMDRRTLVNITTLSNMASVPTPPPTVKYTVASGTMENNMAWVHIKTQTKTIIVVFGITEKRKRCSMLKKWR
jgi:hypothetical protein